MTKRAGKIFTMVMTGVLTSLMIAGAFALPAKQPKIVFKDDAKDFGKVKQGETLTYEFVFKNEGDDVLNVKDVETSCGCAAAIISSTCAAFSANGFSHKTCLPRCNARMLHSLCR